MILIIVLVLLMRCGEVVSLTALCIAMPSDTEEGMPCHSKIRKPFVPLKKQSHTSIRVLLHHDARVACLALVIPLPARV